MSKMTATINNTPGANTVHSRMKRHLNLAAILIKKRSDKGRVIYYDNIKNEHISIHGF